MPLVHTSGWRYFGDTYWDDPFFIGGADVWKHEWTSVRNASPVSVSVADEPHRFDVYQMKVDGAAITFAAGELGPQAWGFCVPVGA